MDEQWWDAKYGTQEQLWSGTPNGLLVVEAADLPPGQALDLGCGEGADALWLAARGWLVTAVDISRVALERAAAAERAVAAERAAAMAAAPAVEATAVTERAAVTEAAPAAKAAAAMERALAAEAAGAAGSATMTAAGAKVCWTHADLAVSTLPAGAFDLVSALYFPFLREGPVVDNVLAAVAPGGTLLVGGHEFTEAHYEHVDFDPDAFYRWEDIGDLLDDTWTVLVNETRPRVSPAPPGSGHVNDTVLKARKKR